MEIIQKYKDCESVKEVREELCKSFDIDSIDEEHPIRKELESSIDNFIKEIFG